MCGRLRDLRASPESITEYIVEVNLFLLNLNNLSTHRSPHPVTLTIQLALNSYLARDHIAILLLIFVDLHHARRPIHSARSHPADLLLEAVRDVSLRSATLWSFGIPSR